MSVKGTALNRAYDKSANTIHPKLTEHSRKMEKKVYKITDNYYLAYGYGLASPSMVIGTDGIIIIDTNEDVEKSSESLKEFRKITDKPIRAVIITHWHPDHWRGIKGFISEEEVSSGEVMVITHEDFLRNVIISHTGGVGPIMNIRNNFTFGNSMELGPEGRINNGIGPDVITKTPSFIAPTKTFKTTLDLEIEDVRMHLRWVPSETEDEIVVWFPDWKILNTAEVIQGETFPNLHAIRGTRYRDPQLWYKGIDVLRTFDAEYMVPTHGRPVFGRENIQEVMTSYRDAIQFVHNQTFRYMNKGYTPDELVEKVKLPAHLARHPWLGEFYGTVAQSVRQIYCGEIGWFHGDPTFLAPTAPVETASRYIDLMGGRDRLLAEAQKAFDSEDYQWTAELTTPIIRVDKEDMEARKLKAQALRELGFRQINTNWRHWYLNTALELEGTLDNTKGYTGLTAPDVARAFPAGTAVESWTTRLVAEKTIDVCMTLGFRFPDEKEAYGFEIRRGVAEFHQKFPEKVDAAVSLDKMSLNDIMLGVITIEDAIDSGKIKTNVLKDDVIRFFNYFDKGDKYPVYLTLK